MIFLDSMRREALKRRDAGPTDSIVFRVVHGWEFGLSFVGGEWHFSAVLHPRGRGSTEGDWEYLGRVARAAGAPVDPVVPIPETNPNAVHHWHWKAAP